MRLLTMKQVCNKVGYSKQHIARLEAAKRFPKRAKPNGKYGRSQYAEHEIDEYIAAKLAERDSSK